MSTELDDIEITKQVRMFELSYMSAYILDKMRAKPNFNEAAMEEDLREVIYDHASEVLSDEEYTQLLNQAEYERNKVAEALIDAKQNSPFVK